MPDDYVTGGMSLDNLLTLFYAVPLAPHYLNNRNACIRPDGRVHGNFPDTGTVFIITPTDLNPWIEAYEANLALFRSDT